MRSNLTISVQDDLKDIVTALREIGHNVITTHEVNKDTSVFILSNVDEDWEELRSIEWMSFEDNDCVLTMNASKLTLEEIVETIEKVSKSKSFKVEKAKKIKISVEEGLSEIKAVLIENGYDVIPLYKVDTEVVAMIFSGVDEDRESISTYQMRQYGESKFVLTMNASRMNTNEIIETINKLFKR
ncbi:MAG: YkuS family protein [Alkaliphilus sp.]|nr:YkuS family protein [Alkaliphilus sp.]